jgi:hypothetical protein
MTSVDEFEPPLPSPAPALAAPDIKPSPEKALLHTILELPHGDQPGLTRCRHYRFASRSTVFRSSTSRRRPCGATLPPLLGSNVLLFPKTWERVANMPPCSPVDETKQSARGVQKSSFREALPRRDASWGPAPRDDHSLTSLSGPPGPSGPPGHAPTRTQLRKLTIALADA